MLSAEEVDVNADIAATAGGACRSPRSAPPDRSLVCPEDADFPAARIAFDGLAMGIAGKRRGTAMPAGITLPAATAGSCLRPTGGAGQRAGKG